MSDKIMEALMAQIPHGRYGEMPAPPPGEVIQSGPAPDNSFYRSGRTALSNMPGDIADLGVDDFWPIMNSLQTGAGRVAPVAGELAASPVLRALLGNPTLRGMIGKRARGLTEGGRRANFSDDMALRTMRSQDEFIAHGGAPVYRTFDEAREAGGSAIGNALRMRDAVQSQRALTDELQYWGASDIARNAPRTADGRFAPWSPEWKRLWEAGRRRRRGDIE